MKLKQLIRVLDNYQVSPGIRDFPVKGISCNSKQVGNDFIFVAIDGSKEDGHRYIAEAIKNGAGAIIAGSTSLLGRYKISPAEGRTALIKVKDTRRALAELACRFYGDPSTKIKVVGITGTNGKTTVSYLVEALLKKAGFHPAVIGTINYRFKDKIIPARNTTPQAIELQGLFARMLKSKIDYAIMEASSHALAQNRTLGTTFHSGIFTNLTQDHLDYHKSLENYFQAKLKLFKGMRSASFCVINNDDPYSRRIKKVTKAKIVTYGIKNTADIMAKDIKFNLAHTEFSIKGSKIEMGLKTPLIGLHNVYNILAAFSWGREEGLNLSLLKSALEEFNAVPGRLERIAAQRDFSIFVDYAHTADALKNVISALRQIGDKRIIVVFGCGGERDKTKRPKMGRVVSRLADLAIITNDNPRSENPQEIINHIKLGMNKNNYRVIPERKEAIRESLSLARPGDIVLVAGKGHENYQIFKNKITHFDDCEVVRECLGPSNY